MSEFKGTKGEWIVDYGLSKGHIKSVNESNSNTPTVARYDIFHDVDREHEQRYNAQLISKAPEMLEALKYALRMLKNNKSVADYEYIQQLIKEATTIE